MDLSKLSDADLQAIESGDMSKVSDAGLAAIADLPSYNPMQGLEDTLRTGAQGATMGYLPQIQGAIESGALSGREYEAAKKASRQALTKAHIRNPVLSTMGEVGGTVAGAMVPGAFLPKATGLVRGALTGGGLGFAQNPGGDVGYSQLGDRLRNLGFGAGAGAVGGYLSRAAGPAAERRAFSALGPTKRDVSIARQKGNLEDIGRTVLDEGVIGNVPRSAETLYGRAGQASKNIGARKSDVINILDEQAGELGYIPTEDVRARFRAQVALNPNLPEAGARAESAAKFAENIGQGGPSFPGTPPIYSPSESFMTLKQADQLKTDVGKFVGWLKKNPGIADPNKEVFNRELYHILNQKVDETAQNLTRNTVLYNPYLEKELAYTKKAYGNLSDAKRILDSRSARDISNRAVSPSDYGVGMALGVGSLAAGGPPAAAAAKGIVAGAANKFFRTYGNQIAAKQLNNLSKFLNYGPAYNATVLGLPAGIEGAYSRSSNPWDIYQGETQ